MRALACLVVALAFAAAAPTATADPPATGDPPCDPGDPDCHVDDCLNLNPPDIDPTNCPT